MPSSQGRAAQCSMDPGREPDITINTINKIDISNIDSTEKVETALESIYKTLNETLTINSNNKTTSRNNNVWWTAQLSTKRANLQRIRRRLQRARKKNDEASAAIYKLLWTKSKLELRQKIRSEEIRVWRALCATVNKDLWGKAYKTEYR